MTQYLPSISISILNLKIFIRKIIIISPILSGSPRKSITSRWVFKLWKMVRAHKRQRLIYFLSLFLFDSQYRSAKYLAYDNYVSNFLYSRIYSKPFMFAFYHPVTFIFVEVLIISHGRNILSRPLPRPRKGVSTASTPSSFSSRTDLMV